MKIEKVLTKKFDSIKLKKSRLKRNISLEEVSKKIKIPRTTLARYENGETKKIPLEVVKKMANIYGTDYRYYYGWNSFPLFGTLTGMLISLFYGISTESLLNGANIGFVAGFLGVKGSQILLNKISKKKLELPNYNILEDIFQDLPKKEAFRYEAFKNMVYAFLETHEIFTEEEIEANEVFLLAFFLAHKVKQSQKDSQNTIEIINYDSKTGGEENG